MVVGLIYKQFSQRDALWIHYLCFSCVVLSIFYMYLFNINSGLSLPHAMHEISSEA